MPFWCYNVFGNANRGHKLFMGDAGSLTLGYVISFLIIHLCVSNQVSPELPNPYMVIAFSTVLVPLLDVIRTYLGRFYDLSEPFDALRSHYEGEAPCDGSVPQALTAFLASDSFEDALRRAVSLGGDTDTLAAISGSLAEPYFGIPASIYKIEEEYFTEEMKTVLQRFDALCEKEKD